MVEILYILLLAASSAGTGLAILRRIGPICTSRAEELTFSIGIGLGGLALATLLLGLLNLLYTPVFYALIIAGLLSGRNELVGLAGRIQGRVVESIPDWKSFYFWVVFLISIVLFLNLLRALMPVHGAVDPLAYHLALPSIYLAKHQLSFEQTLTGTLYPDNIGMLYTMALALRGATLAQSVHWFLGFATILAIYCFCRDYFSVQVGLFAAVIYTLTPVVLFFSPLAYVDVGVGFFQFMALWALFKWMREGGRRTLVLVATFTGLAMGSKHTALFLGVAFALVIFARLLNQRESPRNIMLALLLYGGMAVLLAGPWYVRAWLHTGNPVWPIANEIFSGVPYGSSFSITKAKISEASGLSWARLSELIYLSGVSLWEWTWNEQMGWQRAIGIHYAALCPLAFLYWRLARIRWLIVCSAVYYLFVVLYIDGNPRYNLAFLALLSVLAGWGATRLAHHQNRPIRGVFRVVFVVTLICGIAQCYALAYTAVNYTLSNQNSDQFLQEYEGNYKALSFVNQQLPMDAKVLLQGIVKGYYCQREYLWDHPYQRVLQYSEFKHSGEMLSRMKALGITHIVRMIQVPASRVRMGYPQYFTDALQEDFRKKHLKLLYRDSGYVVFEVVYPT